MRLRSIFPLLAAAAACYAATSPPDDSTPENEPPLAVTAPFPLTDLGRGTYLGFQGGLYPDGSNDVPAAHAALGASFVSQIEPRNTAGLPDANGKIVLLSVGMSNATQEFCGGPPVNCQAVSFIGQALADAAVNHSHLVIADGAQGGQTIANWDSPSDQTYTVVRDQRLAALGVTEAQVQAVWLKEAIPGPTVSLPSLNADAYAIMTGLGNIARTLRVRYPNLKVVFMSRRIYGGYAPPGSLNPEPFAFESGLAVKWTIEAQIVQTTSGTQDARGGDLAPGVAAPLLAWGPYLWADGTSPRSDGLVWEQADFAADLTHPALGARQKVGAMLLAFFNTSSLTQCWFLAGHKC